MPILVGMDRRTGQLFFCSAKGSCLSRDVAVDERVRTLFYEAWPQLQPSESVRVLHSSGTKPDSA